jgi:hypothetical protein
MILKSIQTHIFDDFQCLYNILFYGIFIEKRVFSKKVKKRYEIFLTILFHNNSNHIFPKLNTNIT